MPRAPLNDMLVKNLKSDTQVTYYDMSLPSFGILVGKRRKTWLVMRGKERKRTVLGHYPAMSLADARRKAHAHLDMLGPETVPLPFPDALSAFRSVYLPTIAPSTAKEWERLLKKHFSNLGDLQKLTARQVYTITETLKPSEANHAIVALKRLLSWCRNTGRIEHSIELSKPNKERSRERVLSLDEIARIWHVLGDDTFSRIVRILLLTAVRRGEATGECWLDKSTVTFPKTKNGKSHILPITPYVRELLDRDNSNNTWSKPMRDLFKRANVTGATLHDCRRSCATHWAEVLKMPPHLIEAALNHTLKGVAGVYNRATYVEDIRPYLERWQEIVIHLDPSRD